MTLFILPSCGEEDPRAANMEKQAATYQELAEMMNQLSEGERCSIGRRQSERIGCSNDDAEKREQQHGKARR